MNELGYGQLLDPNQSPNLVLMPVENHQQHLDISFTLVKDLIESHSLSQSPLILRANDPILIPQSPMMTLYHTNPITFGDPMAMAF